MRLRQYYAQRYNSASAVQGEFEQLIRYINSAELGNKSIAELLSQIFDESGKADIGLEMRYDASNGLQQRIGGGDWLDVADADDLRGAPGVSVGSIDSPMFFNRQEFLGDGTKTVFTYYFSDAPADLMVFVNGALQANSQYTYNSAANTVTITTPPANGVKVTVMSIRNNAASAYRRTDFVANASQTIFPFEHTELEELVVFRNGVLQKYGADADFTNTPAAGIVTTMAPQNAGAVITVMVTNNSAVRSVLGIMLEDRYTTDGLIRLDRINLPDGGLAQAKVSGLVSALSGKPNVYVQETAPAGVPAGSLWVNTGRTVPSLNFWDGGRWLDAAPTGLLPSPTSANVLQFLRLNSTGTALEFTALDLSGYVSTSLLGAAGGVARLDSSALVPTASISDIHRRAPVTGALQGAVASATYDVGVLASNRYAIDSLTVKLGAGTCSVQLVVGGVNVGTPVSASTAAIRQAWGGVTVDASTTPKLVQLVVSSATGVTGLQFQVGQTVTG